jgi:hypothetical protein
VAIRGRTWLADGEERVEDVGDDGDVALLGREDGVELGDLFACAGCDALPVEDPTQEHRVPAAAVRQRDVHRVGVEVFVIGLVEVGGLVGVMLEEAGLVEAVGKAHKECQ